MVIVIGGELQQTGSHTLMGAVVVVVVVASNVEIARGVR